MFACAVTIVGKLSPTYVNKHNRVNYWERSEKPPAANNSNIFGNTESI